MGWTRNKYISPSPKVGEFYLSGSVGVICGFGIVREDDCLFSPSTDRAASDALDDAILKKLKGICYRIYEQGGFFVMKCHSGEFPDISVMHEDKKICRALFAKKLFTK